MNQALREQLAKRLGMVGSDHDGEALNATRAADKLIKKNKLNWVDVLSSNGGDSQLVSVLRRELEAARRENQQLRAQLANHSPFEQRFSENHALQAQWALALYQEGAISLNSFEHGFLENIAGRRRPLTERQQPVFAQIILKVRRLSGQTPP